MFISYAQNFEDVILNRVFADKKEGFYIDVGAQHPIYDSVTKAFYDRGWQGINIEPVKEYYELLAQERERDLNLNLGVGETESELDFFELEGTGLSTFDRETAARLSKEEGYKINNYQVPIVKLADICQQHLNCQIDFLKIDVEGWEENVILGNDWSRFRPTVIIVEATIPNSPTRAETNITEILKEQNYQQVYFDGLNDYYLANESSELIKHFATPPNVFDKFISFHLSTAQSHAKNLEEVIKSREEENNSIKNQLQYKEQELIETQQHLQNTQQHLQHKEQELIETQQHLQHKQQQLEESERHSHIFNNRLKDAEFEIQRLTKILTRLQNTEKETSDRSNQEIAQLQTQLAAKNQQLNTANQLIAAMETSKFWKIRSAWFGMKNSIGIKES